MERFKENVFLLTRLYEKTFSESIFMFEFGSFWEKQTKQVTNYYISDQSAILYKGQMMEKGLTENIYSKPSYKAVIGRNSDRTLVSLLAADSLKVDTSQEHQVVIDFLTMSSPLRFCVNRYRQNLGCIDISIVVWATSRDEISKNRSLFHITRENSSVIGRVFSWHWKYNLCIAVYRHS